MHAHIDILARVSDIGTFRRLLMSLDAQVTDPSCFTVVAVPEGLDDAGASRLRRLADFRPNLTVAPPSADWAATGVADGDYVLPLDHDEVMLPGALEQLLAAVSGQPDVVIGRGVVPGRLTDWELLAHATSSARAYDALDLAHVPVLVRRTQLEGLQPGSGPVADLRASCLAATRAGHALRGAPLLRAPAATPESRGHPPMWTSASWSDLGLDLEIQTGRAPHDVSWVSLRSLDSGIDWRLEHHQREEALGVRIDPTRAADDQPLADGRWVVDVRTTAGTVHALRWRESPGSALLGSMVVSAVKGKGERLLLDLGATRRSPLRDLDPRAAEIKETARGTELRWPLPLAHVTGDGVLAAGVRLGEFPLTAQVRLAGAEAWLHVWLSGLAGRTPVAVSIAGSAYHDSDCDLEIAQTGEMTLSPRAEFDVASDASARSAAGLTGRVRQRLGR